MTALGIRTEHTAEAPAQGLLLSEFYISGLILHHNYFADAITLLSLLNSISFLFIKSFRWHFSPKAVCDIATLPALTHYSPQCTCIQLYDPLGGKY